MQFELQIIHFLQDLSGKFLDIVAQIITMIGEQYTLIIILAFVYFVLNKKAGEYIAYSLFTSLVINNTIKGIVQRQRPFQVDSSITGKRAHTATGFSFPSGHTQATAVFFTSLTLMYKKRNFAIYTTILIVLVAISRMYLGVHFLTDVLTSIVLGVGCSFLTLALFNKFQKKDQHKHLLFAITAILFFPFLFIFYKGSYEATLPFRDFYTVYGLFLGFIAAVIVENKFVNFNCDGPLKKRILRFILSLVCLLVVMFGLKLIFPKDSIFFDVLRYFLVSFLTMGIFPLVLKKQLFS